MLCYLGLASKITPFLLQLSRAGITDPDHYTQAKPFPFEMLIMSAGLSKSLVIVVLSTFRPTFISSAATGTFAFLIASQRSTHCSPDAGEAEARESFEAWNLKPG